MPRKRKSVKRRAATKHRRRRDPVAAPATAMSRHRRRPAKREPSKRRAARGFWLRDFLGLAPATSTSKTRRKPARVISNEAGLRAVLREYFRRTPGMTAKDLLEIPRMAREAAQQGATPASLRASLKSNRALNRASHDWPGRPKRHATAARKGWRTGHKKAKKRAARKAPARRGR